MYLQAAIWTREKCSLMGGSDMLSNLIIKSCFETTKEMIEQRFPEKKVDFYVNCDDSHFYIDGEEQI